MAGHDIFISYSRADRSAAKYFAECLTQEGFSVWWDAALHSGESFDQVIERELRAAAAAIVLWSPRSTTSRWVRAEATLADRHGKLIPVTIEGCERPIIFELTHTTDLSDWAGDKSDPRWNTLVQDVARLVGQARRKVAAGGNPPQKIAAFPTDAGRSDAAFEGHGNAASQPAPERRPAVRDFDDSQATQFSVGTESLDVYHCLEIGAGDNAAQRFIVSSQGLKIGRAQPADIVLSDRQVSRVHCLVELDGRNLRVTDLNSTNGTFIDGKRLAGPTPLAVGSVLAVGNVRLRHQVRGAPGVREQQFAAA